MKALALAIVALVIAGCSTTPYTGERSLHMQCKLGEYTTCGGN